MTPRNDTLEAFVQDLLSDPSRARPLSFAEPVQVPLTRGPDYPAFWRGIRIGLAIVAPFWLAAGFYFAAQLRWFGWPSW